MQKPTANHVCRVPCVPPRSRATRRCQFPYSQGALHSDAESDVPPSDRPLLVLDVFDRVENPPKGNPAETVPAEVPLLHVPDSKGDPSAEKGHLVRRLVLALQLVAHVADECGGLLPQLRDEISTLTGLRAFRDDGADLYGSG